MLTKGPEWEYEHEWRTFRMIDEATETVPNVNGDIALFDLAPSTVRSITFGLNATTRTLAQWVVQIDGRKDLEHIKLRRAIEGNAPGEILLIDLPRPSAQS